MDIFDSRYYKTNHIYMRILGLWPFGDASKIRTKRLTVIFLLNSLILPQIIRLVKEWGKNIDVVIEVIGSLIYFTGCQLKYVSYVHFDSKMKILYQEIAKHWIILSNENEQKLLRDYAEIGRIMAIGYLIPINIILMIYITVPLAPIVLDIIDPLNKSRPKAFPYFAEYFIDDQKYYFELTVHGWIVCILSVQIYGTFDTIYSQCVQHASALFAIVEYRVQKATQLVINYKYSIEKKDELICHAVIDAINLHKQAIQYSIISVIVLICACLIVFV